MCSSDLSRPKCNVEDCVPVSGALADVAVVFVAVIDLHLACWYLSEILVVGLLIRCGLGDVAMVGDVSYRVNSKESPNPAKWSPIRPASDAQRGSSDHVLFVETKEQLWPSTAGVLRRYLHRATILINGS